MLFEEIDTEERISSVSEVSSLDNDFDRMHLEYGSSDEEIQEKQVMQ